MTSGSGRLENAISAHEYAKIIIKEVDRMINALCSVKHFRGFSVQASCLCSENAKFDGNVHRGSG